MVPSDPPGSTGGTVEEDRENAGFTDKKEGIPIRNTVITLFLLLGATFVSLLFQHFTASNVNVTIVYMMAVLLIARFTDGYIPGIIASVISVVCVNLIFTYPYMQLNFMMAGYPLTFLGMMLIAFTTSTATTHLKEKSHILREREKLLMEAEKERMRANLLRAISHDLRTPLTSIIGASSAFLEQTDSMNDQQKNEMVQNIYEDSNWLLNMVENLLSVTRIRDNQTTVAKTQEPLEEVVSEAIGRFHRRIPDARVQVSVPNEFIMIPLDATLIEQVIINLLENAYYHGHSPEPIKFTVTAADSEVTFDVMDFGEGIPSHLIDTIFDGYSNTPNNGSDTRKGMGIGLSICKTIINAHGGMIRAENHRNGANFIFTLPLGEHSNES